MAIIKIEEADWIGVVATDDYDGITLDRKDGINGIITRAELLSDNKIRLSSPRTGDVDPYFTEEIGNNLAGDWSDVDLYGVRLQAGDRLIVDVDSFDDDGRGRVVRPIDTMIRVFDRDGTELGRAGTGIDPDSGIFSDDPVLDFTAPNNDTFYIGISAQGNGQYNPTLSPDHDSDRKDPRSDRNQPSKPNVERNYQVELTLIPPPYFFINDVVLPEGTATQNVAVPTAFMSGPSNLFQSVIVQTQNGTAFAWEDFFPTSPNQSVPFNPGVTSGLIVIPIVNDNVVELNETLTVHLIDPDPNGGPFVADPIGNITIVNDDQAVIKISDAPAILEGDSGQTNAVFTVTMSNPVDVAVTVNWATAPNTATQGIDYVGSSGVITFNRRSTIPQTISVPVIGDTVVEPTENFFVNLSGLNAQGRNVLIADPQGLGTIIDNETSVIKISDAPAIIEGDSGQKNAVFTVTMSNPVDVPVKVNWATAPNTATQGIDYVGSSGVITFNPLSTTPQTISVPVIGDTVMEPTENFFVNLSGLNAQGRNVSIADPQGLGTIIDNDTALINISDAPAIIEGDSGQQNAVFTVTMSNPVDVPVTVNWATAPNTATQGIDYVGTSSGSITFDRLSTTPQRIYVPIIGDKVVEFNETFFVNLSGLNAQGRNVSIVDPQGSGTITDDDTATITINNREIVEGDSGQTFANFTVNLSNPVATNVTLNVVTTPDTATENEDYNRVTSSVSFAPLSTTPQTISVPVNGDNLVENDETFFVNLNSLNAGGLEGRITVNSPGIGTIIDDDFAPEITLECPCNIITEGDTLIIDAIATDEDDQVLSYKWDLDGDGDYDENITTDTSTLNIDYQKLQDLGIGVNPLEDPIYRYQGTFNVEVSDGTNTDTTSGTLKVKHKPLEKLIDLTGFDNADVSLDITLSRDASFDSIIGFYRTDYQGKIIDNQGQVIDLLPGAPGYEDAVKANLLPQELKVRDKETVTIEVDLLGGAYYAPALTIKPTFKISDTFATIGDIVNTRLGSQSRIMRNDNIWSFEDWTDFDRDSNGNFNDIVMSINFPQSPSCLC